MPLLCSSHRVLPACAAVLLAAVLGAQSPAAGLVYESLPVPGLDSATAMAFLPDGRLLLTERTTGNIRMFRDRQLDPLPWATIAVAAGPFDERGLLGIAVDPAFSTNGFVYVFYTDPSTPQNRIARLQEVGGVGTNLTVLSPANAIPSLPYHNSGAMIFGVDGKLYVATGDALNSANAHDLSGWLGKVLRFDVPNLTVPGDNPFPGSPTWSYGHRNHFGFAVHPVSGHLYQTENGAGLMDELNRIVPGGDYGWPTYEGSEPVPDPAFVDPIATYQPTIAPTGTCFYSGSNYPSALRNVWFFTDFNYAYVHALLLDASGDHVVAELLIDDGPGNGIGIAMGPDGNLWFLSNDGFGYGGNSLGRYVFVGEPVPSINMTSVSNRTLDASTTVCIHGKNGGLAASWLSLSRFAAPLPTPWGDLWVPPDVISSVALIAADERCYQIWNVPFDPSLLGAILHAQGLVLEATGVLLLTNATDLVVRG